MSGIFDTVMVTAVPGGPEVGEIVMSGLGSEERSEVAYTALRAGRAARPIMKKIEDFLNAEEKFPFITNKN